MQAIYSVAMAGVVAGLLSGIPPACGQAASAPLPDYIHRTWSTEDGLPQTAASALVQTRDGYLWVGTWQGLARFDGTRFTTFEAATTDGLDSDRITALFEDRDGTLWIGTETGGLSRYRDGVFTTFNAKQGLPCDYVQTIFPGEDGGLWVGCLGGVMAQGRGREGALAFTTEHGLPEGRIWAVLESGAEPGTRWVGTDDGVLRIRGEEQEWFTEEDGLIHPLVRTIAQSRDGALWFGTSQGISRLRQGRIVSYPIAGSHIVVQILEARDGAVWAVVDGGGLFRFDGAAFVPVVLPGDPIGTGVVSALEDREGSLWVGTNANGLHRLTRRLFSAYTVEDGLPGSEMLAVYEDRAGAIWAGTSRNGLARIRDGRIQTYTVRDGLPTNRVWTLGEDPEGQLWIGAQGGLMRFDGRRFVSASPSTARAMTIGPSGRVWVTTFETVHQLLAGSPARQIDEGIAVPPYPIDLHETQEGTVWIGTSSDGLCRLGDGPPTCYTTADGLASNTVRAIVEAAPDTLWLGTYGGGLCQFTAGAITCLTKAQGLPDGTIHNILIDDFGYLWLPSNKGLFRLARRDVMRFFAGEIDWVFPDVYGQADGMPSNECNGGFQPAGWKARDGRLWLPTTKGLAVIDPAQVAGASPEPVALPVHVEHLAVDGRPQALTSDLALKPGSDRLAFQFTAPYLSAPEKVRFRYRLTDHDEAWIEAGGERSAIYTNLPPGAYVFQVQAAVGNGPWSTPGGVQAFTLRPFFYQTWWFFGLCALVAAGLAAGGYRVRVRHLTQRQRRLETLVAERTERLREEKRKTEAQTRRLAALDEAKSRFFANISHEFRTPLTLILGALEQAPGALDDPPARARREAMMAANARRLLHLVNQLLDLARIESGQARLRPEAGDLAAFLRSLVQTFTPMAERAGIALQLRAPADELAFVYDRDAVEKIVGNLLSNALKFTPEGGKVWMTLHAGRADQGPSHERGDARSVEITVKDTGPGIPAEALPKIFDRFQQVDAAATRRYEGTGIGLSLARELVELHGGEIVVESEPGFGSAFTVRLPRLAPADDERSPEGRQASGVLDGYGTDGADTGASLEVAPTDGPAGAATVLVVEDNADVRALLRSYLAPHYTVVEAADGRAGLEAARRAAPDLILTDVMMPEMDGFALVRAVKEDERLRAVPVILLTARASEQDTVHGLEAGADDYLAKPFSADELRARVARHLAVRRQLRARYSREVRVEPAGIAVPSEEEAFMAAVAAAVEAQMSDVNFGPEALADALGISPRQLRRRLRAALGESPARLIRRFRLERAARLLEERAGTVAEVAYRVGFKNADHFSTAFRKHFGSTPTARTGDADA